MTDNTSTTTWVLAYVAALITLTVLDGIWLGFVAKDFYKQEMGALMTDSVRIGPAAAFYLLYPVGIVYLASVGASSFWETVLRAAVLGVMAYGAYDATNLATLKGWSLKLSLADVAWGTFASAVAGASVGWIRFLR